MSETRTSDTTRRLANALAAERIKIRRTPIWRMAAIFPFAAVLLPGALMATRPHVGADATLLLVAEGAISVWGRALSPLFAVMLALASFQNEHTQGMWKHLNVMPTRGLPQTLAKHLVAAVSACVATAWLVVFCAVAIGLIKLGRPDLTLPPAASPTWRLLSLGVVLSLATGMALLAPLLVAASRAPRSAIGVTLAIGACATVLGNGLPGDLPLVAFFPWSSGVVWSELLEGDPAGMTHLWCEVAAAPFWIAGSIVLQVALQKRRPLF